MRITCRVSTLRDACSIAARVAPKKAAKPVLTCARLRARDGSLVVSATDLEVSVRLGVPGVDGSPTEEGVALAHALNLAHALKGLPDGDVTIIGTVHGVTLETGAATVALTGDNPQDFPELPTLTGATAIVSLPAGDLAAMVQRVAFAAAKEKTRYAMNGVALDVRKDRLRLVATDGKRLALDERPLPGPHFQALHLVPTLAAVLVAELGHGSGDAVAIYETDGLVYFHLGAAVVICRVIEGHFPPYEDILPKFKALEYRPTFERKAFAKALKQASALCARESQAVRFRFNGSLEMVARTPDRGESKATVAVDVTRPEGAELLIGFNPAFIADALKTFTGDRFAFAIKDALSPAMLVDPTAPSVSYVLMPINLS